MPPLPDNFANLSQAQKDQYFSTGKVAPVGNANTQIIDQTRNDTGMWVPSGPPTLNSTNLASATQLTIPPKVTPTTPNTAGYQTTLNANGQNITSYTPPTPAPTAPAITPTTDSSSMLPDWLKKYLPSSDTSKTPNQDAYTSTYGQTPEQVQAEKAQREAELASKNQEVNTALDKYKALDAQIQGKLYQAKADQVAVEGQGRGIDQTILSRQQGEIQRRALIDVAPLQYQATLAQAEVASAQGRRDYAASLLKTATDHLDTIFQAKLADNKAVQDREDKVASIIIPYLTAKEKQIYEDKQNETKTNISLSNNYLNDLQTAIKTAAENGNTDLAGRLSNLYSKYDLTGNSPTFAEDYKKANAELLSLSSQIRPKTKATTSISPTDVIATLKPEQKTDPFILKLANSAGGKPLTDTSIQSLTKGLNVLGQLGVLQTNIQNTNTGPITGAFRGVNPWDTNAQTIKAQLNAIVPNLARGIYGEVGVLTDNDIKTYSKTLPNLTSTEDVRNAVLGITLDLIGKSIKNTLEVNAAAHRDVSGYVDIYTNMLEQRDSIFNQIPGYKGNTAQVLSNAKVTNADQDVFKSVVGANTGSSGGFFNDLLKGLK